MAKSATVVTYAKLRRDRLRTQERIAELERDHETLQSMLIRLVEAGWWERRKTLAKMRKAVAMWKAEAK